MLWRVREMVDKPKAREAAQRGLHARFWVESELRHCCLKVRT